MNNTRIMGIVCLCLLAIGGAMAATTTLDVTACSTVGAGSSCSVSGFTSNDTTAGSTGLTVGKGDTGTADTMSNGALGALDTINSVQLNFRHDGNAGIGGAWTIELRAEDGTSYSCSDNSLSHVTADEYIDLDFSGCSLTAAELIDLEIYMASGDDKGSTDAFVTFMQVTVDHDPENVPSTTINLVANETEATVNEIVEFNITATDAQSDNYILTVCSTNNITNGTQGNCSVTTGWDINADEGDGVDDTTNIFVGDTAANIGHQTFFALKPTTAQYADALQLRLTPGTGDFDGTFDIWVCEMTNPSVCSNTYDATTCKLMSEDESVTVSGIDDYRVYFDNGHYYFDGEKDYAIYINSTSNGDSGTDTESVRTDSSIAENRVASSTTGNAFDCANPAAELADIILLNTETLCISSSTTSGSVAVCNYTANYKHEGSLTAYSFVCDDGSNLCNTTSTTDTVTINPVYGTLNATIRGPTDYTNVSINQTFFINATVTCTGPADARCGIVEAIARYNKSSTNPDYNISITLSDSPLYIFGTAENHLPTTFGLPNSNLESAAIGDSSSNDRRMVVHMVNTTTEMNITKISFLTPATSGSDYLTSGDVDVYMCGIDSNVCDFSNCTLVNNTWDVQWQREQEILMEGFFIVPNKNYTLVINTTTSDNDGTTDDLDIQVSGASISANISMNNLWDLSTCETNRNTQAFNFTLIGNVESNPTSCASLGLNEHCNVSFTVNFTGNAIDDNETYLVDVLFNSTTYFADISTNDTLNRLVQNRTSGATPPAGDSCDYSSGDFNIDCTESCTVDSAANVGGNDVRFNGDGKVYIAADITNWQVVRITNGCDVAYAGGSIWH